MQNKIDQIKEDLRTGYYGLETARDYLRWAIAEIDRLNKMLKDRAVDQETKNP
jgi:hypothetical protein